MKIVIIGAGPCGLGAAKRLHELGHEDWLLFERENYVGGLAASFKDDNGFTWDIGGHVTFSHYKEFDRMLEETCGDRLLFHRRKSMVKLQAALIPYPFQNNLRYLPDDLRKEALDGLKNAPGGDPSMSLEEWMMKTFGSGICKLFMNPYNQKVWATDLSLMSSDWIAERISIMDYEQALRSIRLKEDHFDWGPNNTFFFPLYGGTGEIFRRLAGFLPREKMVFNSEVLRIDLKKKRIELNTGESFHYDYLITTIPVNELSKRIDQASDPVINACQELRYSGTYIVGCGVKNPLEANWSWMYFPEYNVPFNRVTNFALYSPYHVPMGNTDKYCAYMCETSFSDTKPEDSDSVVRNTWKGLWNSSLVSKEAQIASEFVFKAPYAYPVPTKKRDSALRVIQPFLMKNNVFSRGRFGAWMYEIGNMDHSYKQGRDVIDFILRGKQEEIWRLK
jgi:protoporphyrinogen oxidase